MLLLEHPLGEGRRVLRRIFTDRDANYLKLLASRLVASAAETCVLLASTQEEPARIVMAATGDWKIDCGTLLREALAAYGLRGGGSPGMAQGQIPHAHLDALFSGLEARLTSH
jgi:alanyl-tRNA synthetase